MPLMLQSRPHICSRESVTLRQKGAEFLWFHGLVLQKISLEPKLAWLVLQKISVEDFHGLVMQKISVEDFHGLVMQKIPVEDFHCFVMQKISVSSF